MMAYDFISTEVTGYYYDGLVLGSGASKPRGNDAFYVIGNVGGS